MSKKKKIYHRNDARASLISMGLSARRILYLTIVQQNRDDDGVILFDENKIYRITAKDYAQLCGIDTSVAYKQLKEGVEEIRTHLMRIPQSELLSSDEMKKRPKDGMLLFTLANYGFYSDGAGYIEVKLDPIVAPYVSNLKNNFTSQFLLSGLRLPDSNANKLYILLREWISAGMSAFKDISVEELKYQLMINDTKTYNSFKRFTDLFFKRAVKKIIETTEFSKIDIEIIERQKRKAYMVRISYEYNEQKQHFKDAGFITGSNKKSKTEKLGAKNNIENKHEKLDKKEELKQIKGRFYDKKTAEASGYNWDDY
ncbi:replication initiation protein [Arsenophonus sp. PmNCSU2021_1]|uniref:replication initiation protein n=1 Tax=Arsenophonus sp. PmNCSU2021_1 TaxID=3118989 RepID=UPI002FEED71A